MIENDFDNTGNLSTEEKLIQNKDINNSPGETTNLKTQNDTNYKNLENEKLIEIKKFDCGFVAQLNNIKLQKIQLIINETQKTIEFCKIIKKDVVEKNDKNKEINLVAFTKINQIDLISFLFEDEVTNEKLENIKKLFNEKNFDLTNKTICLVNYLPIITKKKCNCMNCFFCCQCQCQSTYKEREFFNQYLFIDKNIINQVKESIYKISLPKLNELQAKNRKRKLLAFVNPIGGKGNALQIWDRALKIFNLVDSLEITTIITKKYKQVYETILKISPNEYDGFIACGGDGIIHEIINGIFHKKKEECEKFLNNCAISPIPAGSGNALSKTLSLYCNDDNKIETHCYYICKGIIKKIDVQEFELRDIEKKIYSVVSFTYGFVADCDLESENLRFLGMFRVTLMGLIRFINLRNYFGCFYYLPENSKNENIIDKMPNIKKNIIDEKKYGLIRENDKWNLMICLNIKCISEDLLFNKLGEMDDGFHYIFTIPENKGGGRWPLLRFLLSDVENGDLFEKNSEKLKNGYNYYKTKWWRFIPKKNINDPDDVNIVNKWEQFFSIDGERYPICPIQCKVLTKVLPVYCGKE